MAAATVSKHGSTGDGHGDHAETASAVIVDNSPASDGEETTAKTRKSRKRTKTGCLTCRKRRIKCGEERPTCTNCTKSRRHCEGYNPRIVFKTPNIDFHHFQNGAASITFPPGTLGLDLDLFSQVRQATAVPPVAKSGAGYTQLRPRPVNLPTAYPGIPTIHRFQHPASLPQADATIPVTRIPTVSDIPLDRDPQQFAPFPSQNSLSSSFDHYGAHIANTSTSDDRNVPTEDRAQLARADPAGYNSIWLPPHSESTGAPGSHKLFEHQFQNYDSASQPEQGYGRPWTHDVYNHRPEPVPIHEFNQPASYSAFQPHAPSTPRDSFVSGTFSDFSRYAHIEYPH